MLSLVCVCVFSSFWWVCFRLVIVLWVCELIVLFWKIGIWIFRLVV